MVLAQIQSDDRETSTQVNHNLKKTVVRVEARENGFSEVTISDRWSATGIGEPTNHVIRWYRAPKMTKVLGQNLHMKIVHYPSLGIFHSAKSITLGIGLRTGEPQKDDIWSQAVCKTADHNSRCYPVQDDVKLLDMFAHRYGQIRKLDDWKRPNDEKPKLFWRF